MAHASLGEFVAVLRQADTVPRPPGEDWKALIDRISIPGKSAEVELVLDDSDGTLGLGMPEVSIVRRLDRTGEGEYRLAGARCRLVDVIERQQRSHLPEERVRSGLVERPRLPVTLQRLAVQAPSGKDVAQ